MKNVNQVQAYREELALVRKSINLKFFRNKRILISGATGLIASYLIDMFLLDPAFEIEIYAISHNRERFSQRFSADHRLFPLFVDIKEPLSTTINFDFVIHAASSTDPKSYATQPVDTMLINFLGSKNLLDVAKATRATFMLLSTCEVYGESQLEAITELDYGYLDPTQVRSCYNESKRASETLAVSYAHEHDIRVVIARLSRTFGPTMHQSDTKALSQFLLRAVEKQNIILNSPGQQQYSYVYVADAVSGILYLLEKAESSIPYNLTSAEKRTLAEMAMMLAHTAEVEVEFKMMDEFDGRGYSKATKAIQDINRITALGWKAKFSLQAGLNSTYKILKELK